MLGTSGTCLHESISYRTDIYSASGSCDNDMGARLFNQVSLATSLPEATWQEKQVAVKAVGTLKVSTIPYQRGLLALERSNC